MAKVVDERTENTVFTARVGDMVVLKEDNEHRIICRCNKLYYLFSVEGFFPTTEGYNSIESLLHNVGYFYIKEIIPADKIILRIVD